LTVASLNLFHISAVQHGNVIEVKTGLLGIDEACSGIRSLQATLMVSLFLGELYRAATLRRVVLIVCGALEEAEAAFRREVVSMIQTEP
jgi:hypothetical protein